MKSVLLIVVAAVASLAATQGPGTIAPTPNSVEQEVLRAEREQRDAYLKGDVEAMKRLVADEFVLVIPGGLGSKATLLTFLRETPVDPTLTLTSEDTHVSVNGDTAVVVGRRVERRRRPSDNREGVAYARYSRSYIKRQGRWQLLSEHLQTIPAPRTAVKIDTQLYDDFVGRYDSPILALSIVRDGDRLIAVPDEKERPKAEILPESETEFFVQGRDIQIVFVRDRKGKVTNALFRVNGADIRAKKVA